MHELNRCVTSYLHARTHSKVSVPFIFVGVYNSETVKAVVMDIDSYALHNLDTLYRNLRTNIHTKIGT